MFILFVHIGVRIHFGETQTTGTSSGAASVSSVESQNMVSLKKIMLAWWHGGSVYDCINLFAAICRRLIKQECFLDNFTPAYAKKSREFPYSAGGPLSLLISQPLIA